MTKEYTPFETQTITQPDSIESYIYLPRVAHLEDPAATVLIDFKEMSPLFIHQDQPMMIARQAMQAANMHITLVRDDHERLVGVISLEKILSELTIKEIEAHRVVRREVQVKTVMTPLRDVPVIDRDKLQHAQVGHVVATLKALQRTYFFVLDTDEKTGKKFISGAFLAYYVGKLLGKHLDIDFSQRKKPAEWEKEYPELDE